MTINNTGNSGVSRTDLDQTRGPQQIGKASSSGASPLDSTPADDSIILSGTNDLVQQALSSGTDARSARVLQLRQLIESNQYHVDAAAVASAVINAHLAGD